MTIEYTIIEALKANLRDRGYKTKPVHEVGYSPDRFGNSEKRWFQWVLTDHYWITIKIRGDTLQALPQPPLKSQRINIQDPNADIDVWIDGMIEQARQARVFNA